MKKCENCNIEFNTDSKYCPLCQNILVGKSESVFPTNIRLKTSSLLLKIILFSSLVIIALDMFIELYITGKLTFTFLIIGALATNLFILYFILKNSNNVLKMFEKYGLILVAITLLWFIATKEVIITNYIIPSLCIAELLFTFVTSIVLKKSYIVKYLSLILLNWVLLLVPAFLVLLKCTTNNLMSYICLLLAIISVIGLPIFYFNELKEELFKILNI